MFFTVLKGRTEVQCQQSIKNCLVLAQVCGLRYTQPRAVTSLKRVKILLYHIRERTVIQVGKTRNKLKNCCDLKIRKLLTGKTPQCHAAELPKGKGESSHSVNTAKKFSFIFKASFLMRFTLHLQTCV